MQTVDFFTPIVDDPYLYGQIAAANALSDIYAMGGEPKTALAIAAFPGDGLEKDDITAIFRGGYDKLREAGTVLLGGHTVKDPEIKFGYAVTGAVEPGRMLTNAGARPGDVLLLTKPLGTGVVGTAIKKGGAPADLVARVSAAMATLNKSAAEAIRSVGHAHACTDVTGFGLLGHGSEMAVASGVTLELETSKVPVHEGVLALVSRSRSGGMSSNRSHFGTAVRFAGTVERDWQDLLFDPQTSGGLLVAVAPEHQAAAVTALALAGVRAPAIGRVTGAGAHGEGILVSVV